MYTFDDKSGRSITLRPEGTAGAARSFLENGLSNEALPQKVYYLTSCYRYEKPQAGRLREFHQFGIECFGTASPLADAEIISVADTIFKELGIKDLSLRINSIGCPECRAKYHAALKEYFSARKDELCDTCKGRLERNPMRILDCKSPVCGEIAKDAPVMLDYLCNDCKEHFESVKKYLGAMNIEYTIDPRIVRGLDYYTKPFLNLFQIQSAPKAPFAAAADMTALLRNSAAKALLRSDLQWESKGLCFLWRHRAANIPKRRSRICLLPRSATKQPLKPLSWLRICVKRASPAFMI